MKKTNKLEMARAMAIVSCALIGIPAQAASYSITTLATFPNLTINSIVGISNSGIVVGNYSSLIGGSFSITSGSINPIVPSGFESSSVTGVNNSGQVSGYGQVAGDQNLHAFVYSNGKAVDLSAQVGASSVATAINNQGQVTGYWSDDGWAKSFQYADGKVQVIGTLGGSYAAAFGINNAGDIVGYSGSSNNPLVAHAFLYSNGTMTDLGTLGGTPRWYDAASAALDINDVGQVVGYSIAPDDFNHAFLYSDGQMHDLGKLGTGDSFATGINNLGQVVGTSSAGAFLYDHGTTVLVNSLLGTTSELHIVGGVAINDLGQIAAMACSNTYDNNACRVVRFDPQTASPVPEPPAALMFLAGIFLSLAFRVGRRG